MVKDIHRLANLGIRFLTSEDGGVIVQEVARSSLDAEVKKKQVLDLVSIKIKSDISGKKVMVLQIGGDGTLRYRG